MQKKTSKPRAERPQGATKPRSILPTANPQGSAFTLTEAQNTIAKLHVPNLKRPDFHIVFTRGEFEFLTELFFVFAKNTKITPTSSEFCKSINQKLQEAQNANS